MLRINLQRLAKITVLALGAASLTGCIVLPRGPFGYHGGHGGYHGGARVVVPIPVPVPRYYDHGNRHPRHHHDHHDHRNHHRNGYPSAGQHDG